MNALFNADKGTDFFYMVEGIGLFFLIICFVLAFLCVCLFVNEQIDSLFAFLGKDSNKKSEMLGFITNNV